MASYAGTDDVVVRWDDFDSRCSRSSPSPMTAVSEGGTPHAEHLARTTTTPADGTSGGAGQVESSSTRPTSRTAETR